MNHALLSLLLRQLFKALLQVMKECAVHAKEHTIHFKEHAVHIKGCAGYTCMSINAIKATCTIPG